MYYDSRLKLGSTCLVTGPSICGKSYFVTELVRNAKHILNPLPKYIEWRCGEIAPAEKIRNVSYIKGLHDIDKVKEAGMIILDDLMLESAKNLSITNLFTRVAHHKSCFVVFITQNLYHRSANSRTMNLNVHYLVMFKNVRDNTIIHTLARQMHPGNTRFLIGSFEYATRNPFEYLFLDMRVDTEDEIRVRGNIFINKDTIVFVSNNGEEITL